MTWLTIDLGEGTPALPRLDNLIGLHRDTLADARDAYIELLSWCPDTTVLGDAALTIDGLTDSLNDLLQLRDLWYPVHGPTRPEPF